MDFEPLSLSHQPLFAERLHRSAQESADAGFVNLWLWRHARHIETALFEGFLCVRQTYAGKSPVFLMPLGEGDLRGVLQALAALCARLGYPLCLRALTPAMKARIEAAWPGGFEFTRTPEHDDYLYDVASLIELKGRAYHAKKNFVNRFEAAYGLHYETLSDDNRPEVIGFLEQWFERAPYPAEAERQGILDLIAHYRRFDCSYGLLRAEGRVAAFTVGEALAGDRVVIHVEKADGAAYPGSYQSINQVHLQREWAHMKIVNREEDLGLEGLKKAKLSYHPVDFVQKYEAALKA
ncbi:MAG: DUF2156 domain-containing protein [Campylobacterales bacterium]